MRKLLYYLTKYDYDLPSPFTVSNRTIRLTTSDGVNLLGTQLQTQGELSFVVTHGLFSHHRAPGFFEFSESLARFGPVSCFDLRGHGLSGGFCTLGNYEALDVAAAVAHARYENKRPVVTIGFSMGAVATVRSAALYEPADAVVSISGPATWDGPRRRSARLVRLAWKIPLGTKVMRGLTGVRIDRKWGAPESPATVAGKIGPAPLLVIHGTDDGFFPPEEAEALLESAGEPKELWTIPGGGHAEGLFTRPGYPVDRARVDAFVEETVGRIRELLGRVE